MAPNAQRRLFEATRYALAAVAADVRQGLSETVGINATWREGERASVMIELPPEADPQRISRAIDLENVEAWCDEQGLVRVAIGPWYTTKDIDQVVLAITKVVHAITGLHGSEPHDHEHTSNTRLPPNLPARRRAYLKHDGTEH